MPSIEPAKLRSQLNFKRNNLFLFSHVLGDLAIVMTAVAVFQFVPYWASVPIVGALIGILMFRSFGIMHECVHKNVTESNRLNEIVGLVYGSLCILPYKAWVQVHLEHHVWAGNLDRDPTMRLIKAYRDGTATYTKFQEFCWRYSIPYLAFRQQIVFWQRVVVSGFNLKIAFQMLVATACSALAISSFGWMPFALGLYAYLLLIELINFPHHMDLQLEHGRMRLPPHEQHKFSRTCVYNPLFSRHVLLNFNYHVEHHIVPDLPWHQLSKAHVLIRETLGEEYHVSHGSEWIKETRACGFKESMTRSINFATWPEKRKDAA